MGGKVSVDSILGEGTTFTCELTTKASYTKISSNKNNEEVKKSNSDEES